MVIYNGITADGSFAKSLSLDTARAKAYAYAVRMLASSGHGTVGWQAIKKMPNYAKVGEVWYKKGGRYEQYGIQWHIVKNGKLHAYELKPNGSLGKLIYTEKWDL